MPERVVDTICLSVMDQIEAGSPMAAFIDAAEEEGLVVPVSMRLYYPIADELPEEIVQTLLDGFLEANDLQSVEVEDVITSADVEVRLIREPASITDG